MKNFKFKFTLFLIIAICLSSIILLSSCNEQPEDIKLYIKNTEAPRATYVQGQELDYTSGSLTYSVNGEETTLALNAEGVTVTGYDKNTLGQQTLTITYNEKTVTVNVTVIPRISAENYETKYFVGDSFDKTKGRLKIAKDDATTFTVNVNSDKVSLVSFDSASAGENIVTLKYKDGSTEYQCEFTVNVYAIESVTLKKPNKTSYKSHDEGIDFSGGYLTVKSTSDGNLTKFVTITEDMVSGFDLSKANEAEHKETPLKQTISISYGGDIFTYEISITYSGVSIIKDRLEIFSDIDWSDDDSVVTPEQGQAAIEAMQEYNELNTSAEMKLISKSELNTIVRTAAFWATISYKEELNNYSDIIVLNGSQIGLTGTDPAKVVEIVAKFKDKNEKLNVYAELLRDLIDDYPDVVIAGNVTVEQYAFVLSKEIQNEIAGIYQHFIDIYTLLEPIDKNWDDAELLANKDNIIKAVTDIKDSTYSSKYSSFYIDVLSPWREKDDVLDILYYYYLNVAKDVDYINDSMFERVPLPKTLDNWYTTFVSAINASVGLVRNSQTGKESYLEDTTAFMYFYAKTIEEANNCKTSANKLYRDLFAAINGDYLVERTIHAYSYQISNIKPYGYLYICGDMMDSDAFMNLWDKYLNLIDIYATSKLNLTDHDAEFKAMLNAFSALTPSELNGFLTSLNFKYDTSHGSVLVTNYEDGPMSTFIDLMRQYCEHVLSEDGYKVFPKLIQAMELYSQFVNNNQYLTDFTTAMAEVIDMYENLSVTDKGNFNNYLGTAYSKYLNIYNVLTEKTTLNVGENEAKLNELKALIEKFYKVQKSIEDPQEGEDNAGLLALLIAIYERADTVYGELRALNENNDAYVALLAKSYEVNGKTESLDIAFFRIRYAFIAEYLLNMQYRGSDDEGNEIYRNVWDVYSESGARDFFESCTDLMYYTYDNTYTKPSNDSILALMQSFRALYDNTDALTAFCLLDGDEYYYKSIRAFFKDALSEEAYVVFENIISAEINYISYVISEDDSHIDIFKEKLEAADTDYADTLTEDEKALTDALYNYYKAIYDALPEPEPEPEPDNN